MVSEMILENHRILKFNSDPLYLHIFNIITSMSFVSLTQTLTPDS